MATVTVTRSDLFPNTTKIYAFPRTSYHQGSTLIKPPTATATANAEMVSGEAKLEGLTAGAEYTVMAEVSSELVALLVQAPAATTALTAAVGVPDPSTNGLLGYSFDPAMTAVGNKFKLTTAGTLYKARIPLKETVKVTNILLYVVKEGATLTALENFIGLFAEGTRSLLGKASAAETIVGFEHAPGVVTIPLETPVSNIGPGYVDVGMYYKGTTAPELLIAPAATAAIINTSLTNAKLRASSADTGLTTALPATMSSTQTSLAGLIWVGLS